MPDTRIDALVKELMQAHEEPAILLYPTEGLPATPPRSGSHLGGLPRLPPGTPWPRTARRLPVWTRRTTPLPSGPGFPLHFLAQVDCAELPRIDPDLPEQGLLLFFGRLDEEMVWEDDPPEDTYRVIYVANPDDAPDAVEPPPGIPGVHSEFWDVRSDGGLPDEDEDAILPHFGLAAHAIRSWPLRDAFPWRLPNGDYDQAAANQYQRLQEQASQAEVQRVLGAEQLRFKLCQVLGHPHDQQSPSRDLASNDVVLFQLVFNVENCSYIMACEIVFLIKRDDLRARRFDRMRTSVGHD